jgi:hypothetical protein
MTLETVRLPSGLSFLAKCSCPRRACALLLIRFLISHMALLCACWHLPQQYTALALRFTTSQPHWGHVFVIIVD